MRRNKTRECIESLLIALALALVIRGFVIEAFVVPTGSMAPTIYGRNLAVTCGSCGHQFAIKWGWGASNRPRIKECPRCGEPIEPSYFAYSRGDRLLVNKFLHKIKGLSRWDVVVFWCPDPSIKKNYIKRLVGLPGEAVQVVGGDLYIDESIERKPPHVQKNMWSQLSGDEFDDDVWKRFWILQGGRAEADRGTVWLLDESGMRYRDLIDDFVVYNTDRVSREDGYAPEMVSVADTRANIGTDLVGDLKLEVAANIPAGAALVVDLADNSNLVEGKLPALRFVVRTGEGFSSMTDILGNPAWRGRIGLSAGSHVIECANVDAALYLTIDGVVRGTYHYAPVPEHSRPEPTVVLGALDGRVGVERLGLYRDIHYWSSGTNGVRSPYQLSLRVRDPETGEARGKNEYFFLGDNSRSSNDCRMLDLDRYPIVEKYIRGKALVRFWPPCRIGLMR